MHELVQRAHSLLEVTAATASEGWKWNALDFRLEELYRAGQRLVREKPETQWIMVNSILEASQAIIAAVAHHGDPDSVERFVAQHRDDLRKLLKSKTLRSA